jgi:hypothetical protein
MDVATSRRSSRPAWPRPPRVRSRRRHRRSRPSPGVERLRRGGLPEVPGESVGILPQQERRHLVRGSVPQAPSDRGEHPRHHEACWDRGSELGQVQRTHHLVRSARPDDGRKTDLAGSASEHAGDAGPGDTKGLLAAGTAFCCGGVGPHTLCAWGRSSVAADTALRNSGLPAGLPSRHSARHHGRWARCP